MPSPAVSIIIPTFDRLEYLKEAVASVLAQTFVDWELIVVDDGSSDGTVAWLESLGEPRITVVRSARTGHKSLLRNMGLARATADWIAFLDSDDRWKPEKLARQLAYHRANPTVRWSYTGRVMIDADGHPISLERFKPWQPHSGWILRQVLALEANIALPSVMAERALLGEVGGFNEAWRSTEDFELWLRLAERCECGLVHEPLLEVRKHRTATAQRPDVSLGFATMYQAFAGRTADPALRASSRTRAAIHAVAAADGFAIARQWRNATGALVVALRNRPFAPRAYRAIARLVWRRLRAIRRSSSVPAA